MPNKPRKPPLGFVVPGAIVGLLFACLYIPIGGGSMRGLWLWIACVVVGAAAGAFWDFVMDQWA